MNHDPDEIDVRLYGEAGYQAAKAAMLANASKAAAAAQQARQLAAIQARYAPKPTEK